VVRERRLAAAVEGEREGRGGLYPVTGDRFPVDEVAVMKPVPFDILVSFAVAHAYKDSVLGDSSSQATCG